MISVNAHWHNQIWTLKLFMNFDLFRPVVVYIYYLIYYPIELLNVKKNSY